MKLQTFFTVIFTSLALFCSSSNADLLTFDLEWTGVFDGATATGFITFDDQILPNPGTNGGGGAQDSFANLGVTDFEITISGAVSGNGTFDIFDFVGLAWDTGGATLDFSNELVGQATAGSPWGTPDTFGGDFNVFAATAGAPSGVNYFTLGTDTGFGSILELSAFTPQAVPEPSAITLLTMLGATVFIRRRK